MPEVLFGFAAILLLFGLPWAREELAPDYYREVWVPPGISMLGIAIVLIGYGVWLRVNILK